MKDSDRLILEIPDTSLIDIFLRKSTIFPRHGCCSRVSASPRLLALIDLWIMCAIELTDDPCALLHLIKREVNSFPGRENVCFARAKERAGEGSRCETFASRSLLSLHLLLCNNNKLIGEFISGEDAHLLSADKLYLPRSARSESASSPFSSPRGDKKKKDGANIAEEFDTPAF